MKIRQISYPHPVLASFNDDYTRSSFEASIDYKIGETSTAFKIAYDLKNTGIENLITTGQAIFVTHLECDSSMYREAFSSNSTSSEFEVLNRKLSKQVDVTFMIVAVAEIENYKNDLLHEDYEESLIEFNKGTFIAVHQGGTLILEKDPLVPAKSIFNIIPSDEKDAPKYSVGLNDDTISILLPRATYNTIEELSRREEVNPLLISMYYLPALMEALIIVVEEDSKSEDHFEDFEWYKSLELHLQRMNLSDSKVEELGLASISNMVLAEVFDKAIDSLSSIYL
ncbi:hypothetical protein [Planococcus lenghuensis]|uniref:Uncharacterized protein n=1 Tax=Planococcus lenghuensis TaxID=2213202 RepID=A0A1Q2L574_9BACL|nr:hypothetical protein [Planococcus lenghuensis]AQQ55605.1 hypothetical protein B0X71_20750 [Planococcus lenghuensis]